MNRLFSILYLTLTLVLFSGCRCVRHTSSNLDRTDTGIIDVQFRSLSQLRDTCAEKQTIRLEFFYPYLYLSKYWNGAIIPADTTDTASGLASVPPCNTGCEVPAIKSIEIITEKNTGKALSNTIDSTFSSQSSNTETQQKEQSSEARQDNGTVAIVSVVAAAVVLILAFVLVKRFLK